ncbi:MAG: aminotransferase class III-fold pyridoxal phosphate-dependent enzyme [Alphaproteobacteria bacterium]|nr:MAG: aminotransferase class III-fold pyridoxal phosphate-dependent enzyme [Alphaproteobacteria bacterium]
MNDLQRRRDRVLGPMMTTFYRDPVELVRGEGVWLWDAAGNRYLDAYNNVPHVGHGHPTVVEAVARQMATLNTHSRYLHEGIVAYAERLTATFADGLDTLTLVCTGSEANDIALRIGWAATGKKGIVATDATYHGNTHLVSQLSAGRRPVGGRVDWVRRVPPPGGAVDGAAFAASIGAAIDSLEADGHGFAALILDPFLANEGFPSLPPGALDAAVALVRARGGIVIADEVQPGFGRLGSHFWGHERMGFVPDVVTLGKPMGNGYPVAGVVTRRDLIAAFREGFGYFNTFAATPVAAAAASAVLDVIESEGLQARAEEVGRALRAGLGALDHPRIREVRGAGLFAGVVFDDDGEFTGEVVERMRAAGVLMHYIGPGRNILKIRPPLVFGHEHVDMLVDRLGQVLKEMG